MTHEKTIKYCRGCGSILIKSEGYYFDQTSGKKIIVKNLKCPRYDSEFIKYSTTTGHHLYQLHTNQNE